MEGFDRMGTRLLEVSGTELSQMWSTRYSLVAAAGRGFLDCSVAVAEGTGRQTCAGQNANGQELQGLERAERCIFLALTSDRGKSNVD